MSPGWKTRVFMVSNLSSMVLREIVDITTYVAAVDDRINTMRTLRFECMWLLHGDFIKWKHFLCYWPFMRGIHWSPVNSPHKGQWRRALMFSLICTWINGCVNNREAGDLRRHHAHYDVILMFDSAEPRHQASYSNNLVYCASHPPQMK